MSWQAYIDTSLVGTGNTDKAAIFSKQGDSVWAKSPDLEVSPTEVQTIVKSFDEKPNPAGTKKVHDDGLFVAGERYIVLKADERSIYGKKGKEGVIIVKTLQAIIIAHYPSNVQPGAAANTVEQLADYLIRLQY